jgi:hypothetical protein
MKNSKCYRLIAIMVMVLTTTFSFAGNKDENTVPAVVVASFNTKYPDAKLEKWQVKDDGYTAKAIIDHHKYFATFDKNGNWVSTASTISWSWSLPATIKAAYNKSTYNSWNIFESKKIEKPSGEFYQLWIKSRTVSTLYPHPYLTRSQKLLDFKTNGQLAAVHDVAEN